ncbi:D-Ala-D-Ala carboxypeptidase family metallohydrolase [Oceaniglobus trochenteri]|uniref:D-Ala-D-Ala carboxypeptidase family metallohydrolase n=1 Tax=Oceaniglobus trochenteri TaxID=2763260 RepID=UPI001CFF8133|nr:D-Ala-D-Ala carboxypeptidase family metallohydrolase [Oceaniglobus trochenteri]
MATIFDDPPELAFHDLPEASEGPETGLLGVAAADFQAEAIDSNYWALRQRRIAEANARALSDLAGDVADDPDAWKAKAGDREDRARMGYGGMSVGNYVGDVPIDKGGDNAAIQKLFDDLEIIREFDPGRFANYPSSFDELQRQSADRVRDELNEERADAERRSNNRSVKTWQGGVAGFIGAAGAAITDVEGVVTLPFGAGAGTLARQVLIEGALGAGSEALSLPARYAQADFLGRERPSAVAQLTFGAAFGGALPIGIRGVKLGANALTKAGRVRNRELLAWGKRKDASPEERAAAKVLGREEATIDTAPDGTDAHIHAETVDDAETAVRADEPVQVVPGDVVPPSSDKNKPGVTRQTLDLIRSVEAPGGYDQVYGGIAPQDLPPKPLTQMTVAEVLNWQDRIDGKYNSEAAGGYQIMEDTLRDLVRSEGLTGGELFDAAMQDRLAIALMRRRGLDDFLAGTISAETFGNNLALEWAGLPRVRASDAPLIRTKTIGTNEFSARGVSDEAFRAYRALEGITGRKFKINSAHRDPKHNEDVGGANQSQHIHGNAFDIDVSDLSIPERQQLIVQAREAGFGGIGVYRTALHFDVGKERAWGPSHGVETVPDWAREAVQHPVTRPRAGSSAYEGHNGNSSQVSPSRFMGILTQRGTYRPLTDDARSADIYSFRPGELRTDASAYQYKEGGDDKGVTDRLANVREWNPPAAIGVMIHERLDGERYIADGHQRLGLAQRLTAEGVEGIELQGFVLREADGWGVPEVRAFAAVKNIQAETGTALDAAKILRDHPELAHMIDRSRGFVVQADGLSRLSPGPFQALINGVIPQNYGAIVGRIMPDDEELQAAAIATLAKAEPANAFQAESMVRDIRRMGLEKRADAAQGSLFGEGFDLGETAINERARVLDAAHKELKRDKTTFARLSREGERIEGAGNVLDTDANTSREQLAQKAIERLIILADEPGPVRDALDAAARAVRGGQRLGQAAQDVIDAITNPDRTDGARADAPGPGRTGDAPADDTALAEDQLGEPGPALTEPDLFGDPVEGRGALAQVDQIERDLRHRMATDPEFDVDLVQYDDDGNASKKRLSDMIAEFGDEASDIENLKTCMRTP